MQEAHAARRALLAVATVWVAFAPAVGSAFGDACPFPLGDYLLSGDVRVIDGSTAAPEALAQDVSWVGVLFSEGHFASDGERVAFTYETEYDYLPYNTSSKSEAHIVAYKEFSTRTGWDTRPVFLSSADVEAPLPVASSTYPTVAVLGSDTFVAWSVAGFIQGTSGITNPPAFWPSTGSYIVLRGNRNGTWGPIEPLSDLGPVAVNIRVQSVATRSGAFFAYMSNAREPNGDLFHISGRFFDGRTLGPVEEVSVPLDGWSDETVTLATDGQRVGAVWAERNATDFVNGSTRVMLRVREPSGSWGDPVELTPPGERYVSYPAVAWHGSQWYAAWSAYDAAASPGGDTSILLRSYQTETATLSALNFATGSTFPGNEFNPALTSYAGRIYVTYASNSGIAGNTTTTADLDLHMRTFDGATLSPPTLVHRRVNASDAVLWPGFFKTGGALFATYGLNLNQGGLGAQNQREVIRLIARQGRSEDNLSATYSVRPGPFSGSGTARTNVRFLLSDRTANLSAHYAIQLGDGSIVRLPEGAAEWNLSLPFSDNSFLPPAAAYWCGQPVALRDVAWPFGAPPPPSWFPTLTSLVPFLVLAAVLAVLAARVRSSRLRAHRRRTAHRRGASKFGSEEE